MTATFAELLAACRPRAYRAALGWLGDEEEAREVAQEALARAWAARDRYDPSRPFYPWLRVIVRNACRDARRRRRRRPEEAGADVDALPSAAPGPFAAFSEAEVRARLRRGLARLRPEHREIIVLRHFEELTYAEIAEILGIPEGTVMSRLFRARRALVRAMRGEEEER